MKFHWVSEKGNLLISAMESKANRDNQREPHSPYSTIYPPQGKFIDPPEIYSVLMLGSRTVNNSAKANVHL